jgi:hypothetical protein
MYIHISMKMQFPDRMDSFRIAGELTVALGL